MVPEGDVAGGQETEELSPEATARWEQISDQVEELWEEVMAVTNNVLKTHVKFGFAQFAENVTPSLDEILLSLQIVESILDTVGTSGNLDYAESRVVGNAKQQILWIQLIGNALKYGNETDYLESIKNLGNQAPV